MIYNQGTEVVTPTCTNWKVFLSFWTLSTASVLCSFGVAVGGTGGRTGKGTKPFPALGCKRIKWGFPFPQLQQEKQVRGINLAFFFIFFLAWFSFFFWSGGALRNFSTFSSVLQLQRCVCVVSSRFFLGFLIFRCFFNVYLGLA